MAEQWKIIEDFQEYSVSDHGRIRFDRSGRILRCNLNQYGLLQVGLFHEGIQRHRSVPLLVAKAFLPPGPGKFDTPINLDGDRLNNHVSNLAWRPRWFAVKFNQQFRYPSEYFIPDPIMDLKTHEVSANSLECVKRYGLLQKDLWMGIHNRTYVLPTYQQFVIIE